MEQLLSIDAGDLDTVQELIKIDPEAAAQFCANVLPRWPGEARPS
jgi:hypothetical protein